MHKRTFIAREEKTSSGFQAAIDQLTVMGDASAAGDCKLKPLLVYGSENSRTLQMNLNPAYRSFGNFIVKLG